MRLRRINPPGADICASGLTAQMLRRVCAQGGGLQGSDCLRQVEGFRSGQTGLTVNQVANAFGGSNPPPSTKDSALCGAPDERCRCNELGRAGV